MTGSMAVRSSVLMVLGCSRLGSQGGRGKYLAWWSPGAIFLWIEMFFAQGIAFEYLILPYSKLLEIRNARREYALLGSTDHEDIHERSNRPVQAVSHAVLTSRLYNSYTRDVDLLYRCWKIASGLRFP